MNQGPISAQIDPASANPQIRPFHGIDAAYDRNYPKYDQWGANGAQPCHSKE
jgi:hypothetical protein